MAAWRRIVGHPRYEVSDGGKVRVAATRRHLKQRPNEGGYMRVRLHEGDRVHFRKVHLLVLEAFVGPRPSRRHHGAHGPDRRKANNRLDNLRWATPEENEADKRAHGTARGGRSKTLPPESVTRIRARLAEGESYSAVAREEGLHRCTVSRVWRGIRRAS